jgi:hypothetical protein
VGLLRHRLTPSRHRIAEGTEEQKEKPVKPLALNRFL